MFIHTNQSELLFENALNDLGLDGAVNASSDGASAFALRRYLRMYRLLETTDATGSVERRLCRQEYLTLMRDFERSISKIRALRRSEMAHSRHWDFPAYLRGTLVLSECRLTLRMAYVGHLLNIPSASRLAQKAGFRMFGSLFFESCVPGLA